MSEVPNVYRTILKVFSKAKLPDGLKRYRPKHPYRAARIDGPFEIEDAIGRRERCEDGYLIIDHARDMYPMDRDEFEASMEEISDGTTTSN